MSAIKYVGRNLWRVGISYYYEPAKTRCNTHLWVATTGSHVKHGVAASETFLRGNKEYPEGKIMSIKHKGTLDA